MIFNVSSKERREERRHGRLFPGLFASREAGVYSTRRQRTRDPYFHGFCRAEGISNRSSVGSRGARQRQTA